MGRILAVRVAIVGIATAAGHARCCDCCCARASVLSCARYASGVGGGGCGVRGSGSGGGGGGAAAVVGRGLASSCALPARIECHCCALWLHQRHNCLAPSSFVVLCWLLIRCERVYVCVGVSQFYRNSTEVYAGRLWL